MEYWYLLLIILLCVIIPARMWFIQRIIRRKRKGEKRKMPTELLKEFVGKQCTISLFNDIGGVQGVILAVEENWIKVEEKKRIRIINGDMIRDISITK